MANALQQDRASIESQESRYAWSIFIVHGRLACVENFDSDLVCARGFHLDIFEFERLACTPAYGSLALDDLPFSFRHDSAHRAEWSHSLAALAVPCVLLGNDNRHLAQSQIM